MSSKIGRVVHLATVQALQALTDLPEHQRAIREQKVAAGVVQEIAVSKNLVSGSEAEPFSRGQYPKESADALPSKKEFHKIV